jgi:hypothetical protein
MIDMFSDFGLGIASSLSKSKGNTLCGLPIVFVIRSNISLNQSDPGLLPRRAFLLYNPEVNLLKISMAIMSLAKIKYLLR